jgi:hypothetical protein
MFAVVAVAILIALSFASLAYIASRKGYHTTVAAAGGWLFGAISVVIWFWYSR